MYKKYVSIFPGNRKSYLHNGCFTNPKIDEWAPIFGILKKYLNKKDVKINTYDISVNQNIYRYVYFDLPYFWELWNFPVWKVIFLDQKKNILLCQEPPTVIPFNYMKVFHAFFTKVYTWNEDLVDNKKYFKMRLPKFSKGINTLAKKFNKKKFLTLINSNKAPFHPFVFLSSFGKELYSERIKAIDYFEKNIPDRFFLYGRGWNRPKKYNLKENLFGFRNYRTYRGEVKNKIATLSNFKYSICFENLTEVNGYITEKIFDCFKAKCIPIYWGASNIEKYISKNCFIDYRDFLDYGKLLEYLNSIDETTYQSYITNIERLLKDKTTISQWFEEGYGKLFLEDILEIKE